MVFRTRPLRPIVFYVVLGQMPFLGLGRPNTSACHKLFPMFFHELSEHKRHISCATLISDEKVTVLRPLCNCIDYGPPHFLQCAEYMCPLTMF